MNFPPSPMTEGEAKTLIAMLFGKQPEEICAWVVIVVEHEDHALSLADSGGEEKVFGAICLQTATRYAERAARKEGWRGWIT